MLISGETARYELSHLNLYYLPIKLNTGIGADSLGWAAVRGGTNDHSSCTLSDTIVYNLDMD